MNDVISDIRFVYAVVHNRRERLSLGGNGLFGKKDLPAAKIRRKFPVRSHIRGRIHGRKKTQTCRGQNQSRDYKKNARFSHRAIVRLFSGIIRKTESLPIESEACFPSRRIYSEELTFPSRIIREPALFPRLYGRVYSFPRSFIPKSSLSSDFSFPRSSAISVAPPGVDARPERATLTGQKI